jgi:hypothetical protein
MDRESDRRRGRAAAAVAVVVVLAFVAAGVLTIGVSGSQAAAGPVRDADPLSASQLADQIIAADATIRSTTRFTLPVAEDAVATTAAAQAVAVAEEARLQTAALPAPSVGGGDVVANAADAITDDLAPEQASAARVSADAAAAAAVAQRDQVKATLDAAVAEKARLLTALDQGGQRRTRWCVALLELLGAPLTRQNLSGLFAWIDAESNSAALLNPLATTMPAPGATNANEVGVKGYPTDAVGLDATVRTLRNGSYPYILAALASGDSAPRLAQAVALSRWGTGINAVRRLELNGG